MELKKYNNWNEKFTRGAQKIYDIRKRINLKKRSIEVMKAEEQRKNDEEKWKSLTEMWDTIKHTKVHESTRRTREKKDQKTYLKK